MYSGQFIVHFVNHTTQLIAKHDIRSKGQVITDVKTTLFLLSKLTWIEGDNDIIKGRSKCLSLKGISKRVEVKRDIISSQCLQRLQMDSLRVNLSRCLMISPALLQVLKCSHVCTKNLLGDAGDGRSC